MLRAQSGVVVTQGSADLIELAGVGGAPLGGGEVLCGWQEVVPVTAEGVQPDQSRHVPRVQLREPVRGSGRGSLWPLPPRSYTTAAVNRATRCCAAK
ncbi:hypothetical protein GCM10027445_19160 [Amycolatopsis endophytica]